MGWNPILPHRKLILNILLLNNKSKLKLRNKTAFCLRCCLKPLEALTRSRSEKETLQEYPNLQKAKTKKKGVKLRRPLAVRILHATWEPRSPNLLGPHSRPRRNENSKLLWMRSNLRLNPHKPPPPSNPRCYLLSNFRKEILCKILKNCNLTRMHTKHKCGKPTQNNR